ncbi:MAG: GFA family protein [Pseudomonadota bacterium]
MSEQLNGQCLCGSVRFHGRILPGRGVGVCHCGQCRRWASGPFMAVRFEGGVTFDADESLNWFRSSEHGERGFCNRCGSSLFWRAPGDGVDVAISVSALPEDHGLGIMEHIWVDDQPDWYAFADDTPRLTAADVLGTSD